MGLIEKVMYNKYYESTFKNFDTYIVGNIISHKFYSQKIISLFAIIFSVFLSIKNVLSEEANSSHSEVGLPILWLNLAIYLVIVAIVAKKFILPLWSKRRMNILSSVVAANDALENAKTEIEKARKEQDNLENIKEQTIKSIIEEGNAEAEKIINQAMEKSNKIKNRSRELIDYESKASIQKIRQDLLQKIIQNTENLVKSSYNKDSDKTKRIESLEKVFGLLN